jgi:probable HAF family extracellular repeat protein
MTDLGTLGGSRSVASAISPDGQIVGQAYILGNTPHAFLHSGGTMTDLNTLIPAGITLLSATAINAAGQIVGEAHIPSANNARHAFLYSPGTVTDLGTLGGTHSVAFGINTTGQVVGSSYLPGDRAQHAFLYSDRMTDLGILGGRDSFAYGINTTGQVVGRSYLPGDLAHHAFRYRSCSGTMIDLNDLVPPGVIVTNATAINTAGQIVGDGRIDGSPHVHALLLTPLLTDRFAYARVDGAATAGGTLDSRYAYNASGGERIQHRHPPRAHPVAPMRERHCRRPRLPPRCCTDQAPYRAQGQPGGAHGGSNDPIASPFHGMRCPPASPIFASWQWLLNTGCSLEAIDMTVH